jgi:hypothetical protein
MIVPLLVVLIINPSTTTANMLTTIENLFIIGHWWSLWWFVLILFIITKFFGPRVNQERNYLYMISAFFVMVLFLGFFRQPYRLNWATGLNSVDLL